MNGMSGPSAAGCAGVRELVVWYPTADLSQDERRLIDGHAGSCEACADLLRFAAEVRSVVAAAAVHPAAAALVQFAEDPGAMAAADRARVEEHLVGCARCAQERAILETVERDDLEPARAPRRPAAAAERAPAPSALRALWDRLAGSILEPAPAAAYLAVAVIAVAVLIGRPGREIEAPGSGSLVEGVVLLSDTAPGVRGAPAPGPAPALAPQIDGERTQLLLLELTNLETPPRAADRYQVLVTPEGSSAPAWKGEVLGAAFGETYSLGLVLAAGTLGPGRYEVAVIAPGGETIFRSALIAGRSAVGQR